MEIEIYHTKRIMYQCSPNLMLGFHGCDESVRDELVNKPNIVKKSQEDYDWLGHGFYVWENNYQRALQWAKDKKKRDKNFSPSVIGVVYQLDYCLDLTDSAFINILPEYYNLLKQNLEILGKKLPQNKDTASDLNRDLVIRSLDCMVLE